jgi:hypothetical protein
MPTSSSPSGLARFRPARLGLGLTRLLSHGVFLATLLLAALAAPQHAAAAANESNTLDVLFVYTTATRAKFGGDDGVKARANAEIAYNNLCYDNSKIGGAHRLAGVRLAASYTEAGSFNEDLDALTGQSDGALDAVHQWRNEVGADVVCLMRATNAAGVAGIALGLPVLSGADNSGFSVIGPDVNWSYAHEIGHNLGCLHDRANSADEGIFYYSFGLHMANGEGTVMSYLGNRIAYFSNPNVSHNGAPTGISELNPDGSQNKTTSANAAKTINTTLLVLSQYRRVVLTTPAITPASGNFYHNAVVSLEANLPGGGLIHYTTDGSPVTADSPTYIAPFSVTGPCTVRARSFHAYGESAEASATYYITSIGAPKFTPESDSYNDAVPLNIASDTASGAIAGIVHYTLDDTDVTEASPVFTGVLHLTRNATVRARAYRDGAVPSWQTSATYRVSIAAPQIIPLTTNFADGQYYDAVPVGFTSATPGVTFRYTLDGNAVTEDSPAFDEAAPPVLTRTGVVRVRAYREGFEPSTQTSQNFSIQIDKPAITPPGGEFAEPVDIYISTRTPGATLRHTLDGSDVTPDSPVSGGVLRLGRDAILKVRAYRDGFDPSGQSGAIFKVFPVALPVFATPGGTYKDTVLVHFDNPAAEVVLRYTLDGSEVTENSAIYDAADGLLLTASALVKVRGYREGQVSSAQAEQHYEVVPLPRAATPAISPAGGRVTGIAEVILSTAQSSAAIRYTLDGSDVTETSALYERPLRLEPARGETVVTVKARAYAHDNKPSAQVEATFTLVPAKAEIQLQPEGRVVEEGASAVFFVGVAASPEPTYQWQRDGVPIAGATENILALQAVTLADDGAVFDVVVTNIGGSVTSHAAVLRVVPRPLPPSITTQPTAPENVFTGNRVELTIGAAANGGDALTYQWHLNGAPIAGATGATYVIEKSTVRDSGIYYVTVGNAVSTIGSNAVVISVRDPVTGGPAIDPEGTRPQISYAAGGGAPAPSASALQSVLDKINNQRTAEVVVAAGSAVLLESRYQAPGASYAWLLNGAAIAGAPDSPVLRIASVPNGGATYSVRVTLPGGRVVVGDPVSLATGGVPVITAAPAALGLASGGSGVLAVKAAGDGPLLFRWFRDGVVIPHAVLPVFTVRNATLLDAGRYRVEVSNRTGVSASAEVEVRVDGYLSPDPDADDADDADADDAADAGADAPQE